MRSKFVAVGMVSLVLLAGCSPTAHDELLESLRVLDSRAADFVARIGEAESRPFELDALEPDPTKQIFIWGGKVSPDDQITSDVARVVVYGIHFDSPRTIVEIRLLGYSHTGGGWLARSEHGYLCAEYTFSDATRTAEREQVECPEIMVPDMGDDMLAVDLDEVLAGT